MKIDRSFVRLVSMLALVPSALTAQKRVIVGLVIDSTHVPVPWANVDLSTTHQRLVTDEAGRFVINNLKPKDKLTLSIRRIGYQPQEGIVVNPGDTTVTVTLAPLATKLATTTISAAANAKQRILEDHGFYSRLIDAQKGINHGYFLTPEDLQKRNPQHVTQALSDFRELVFTRRNGSDPLAVDVRGPTIDHFGTGLSATEAHCFMTVYLDGQRILGGMTQTAGGGSEPEPLDAVVSPTAIAGIEVYPFPSGVPPKYQLMNGTCGVILIWTK